MNLTIAKRSRRNIFGAAMVTQVQVGKTRVLTYRIAHMMENGIDPFNILALTFTNKAAKEMTERISNISGGHEAKNITMGTFHSVFSKSPDLMPIELVSSILQFMTPKTQGVSLRILLKGSI